MPKPKDQDSIKRYADEHIIFEIEQLVYTANYLGHHNNGSQVPDPTYEVHYAAFAIHARNLDAFLSDRGRASDVLARDFVIDQRRRQNDSNNKSKTFEQCRPRLHRQIAHLTYDRESAGEKSPMDVGSMMKDLNERLREFMGQADCNKISIDKIREALEKIKIKDNLTLEVSPSLTSDQNQTNCATES